MIEELLLSKRIAIFGYPACGKSTLAEVLSSILNIESYSLDLLRWNTNQIGIKDDEQFLEQYNKILKKDKWIIEGNALDWIDSRLEKADILIFFDSTVENAIKNFIERERKISEGLEYRKNFNLSKKTDKDTTIDWIKNRYSRKIEKLKPVLNNYVDKLIVINNYNELDSIIKDIRR